MVAVAATAVKAKPWRDFSLRGITLDDNTEQPTADGRPRSWIMLMPEGTYEHPQYGELKFTRKKLEQFKRNFDDRVRKIDIALDQDHDAGKAVGWLERMEMRGASMNEPAGLWGLVAWTSLGVQLLRDRIYGYFSPEFGDYVDEESNQTFHDVIIGGGLTNRPYLKVMPAVRLSDRYMVASEMTFADVSNKPWGSVDKTKLPRACFIIKGDASNKSTWKLPIYEGAGSIGPDGMYTKRGPLNINGVQAAIGAIHGARSGSPMSGVPAGTVARLENLLKRYGGSSSGGGAASSKAASEGNMGTARQRKTAEPTPVANPTDDEDNERFADDDTDGKDEAMDDNDLDTSEDGSGFDPDENTHGAANTDSHMHGKYGAHSHDGDADHSDAPMKGSSRKASSKSGGSAKKASDVYTMSDAQLRAEVARLREVETQRAEENRQMAFKLYERDVAETLEGWGAQTFQFTEGKIGKQGHIATSKRFDEAYRKLMLTDAVRWPAGLRDRVNKVVELALSSSVVDLSERSSSFDQESRRTVRKGGERSSMVFDEEAALIDEGERIALSEYHKPMAQLPFDVQLEIGKRAERTLAGSR